MERRYIQTPEREIIEFIVENKIKNITFLTGDNIIHICKNDN
jgi:hypothetical protein